MFARIPGMGHYEINKFGEVRHGFTLQEVLVFIDNGILCVIINGQTRRVGSMVASTYIGVGRPGMGLIYIDGDQTNPELTNLKYEKIRQETV